jgi:Flp pilus assembly protein TadG
MSRDPRPRPHRSRNRRAHPRGERGVAAVELVLYTPLLMFAIFLVVQFAMVYLGNNAASSVAREAARVARTTGSVQQAHEAGLQYAQNIGKGILEDYDVTVTKVGDDRVRVTVTGHAQEISPIGVPTVSQTVEGPLELFVETP